MSEKSKKPIEPKRCMRLPLESGHCMICSARARGRALADIFIDDTRQLSLDEEIEFELLQRLVTETDIDRLVEREPMLDGRGGVTLVISEDPSGEMHFRVEPSSAEEIENQRKKEKEKTKVKRIAIPVAQGKLCAHFGHCEVFSFVDLDEEKNEIVAVNQLQPPPHEPGVLPRWVAEQGAHLVLAGGMGGRAIQLFNQAGVEVLTGCPSDEPELLVRRFAQNILETGVNTCNHDENHVPDKH